MRKFGGFFSTWAQESLSNTRAVLVKYPKNTRSIAECINDNYSGRTYDAFMNLLSSEPGTGGSSSVSGSYNGHINSGVKYVNVRQEPNTTSTILGQLYGNNKIQILAKVKPYGDSYYWYKIVFIKDEEKLQAYVREDFVTVTGEIPKDDIPAGGEKPGNLIPYDSVGQVTNNASSVHVRKGAGIGAGCDVITSVTSGELLMIIGKTQPGGQTIPWYEINLNGQELYIRSDFVDIVPETKLDEEGIVASTTTTYAHVRYLPGTGSECATLDTLYNGTKVEILGKLQPQGQSLPWYRVKYAVKDGSTKIGFIRTDLVRDSGGITPDTNPSDIQNPKYVQIAKSLGFNVNTSLRNGIMSTIKGSHNIYFQGEAIEINEEINTTYAAKIVNGQIVNARESIDYLGIPFGNSGIKEIASTLNNGYIECNISEGNISFKIKDLNYSRALNVSLQCISNIQEWKDFTKEISPFTQAENGLIEALDTVVVKTTVMVAAFAFTMIMLDSGRTANASEITEVGEKAQAFLEDSPLYLKEGIERLKGYIEDLTVKLDTRVNPKELNPMFQSEFVKAKEKLEKLAIDNADGFSKKFFKKIKVISIVKDLENI